MADNQPTWEAVMAETFPEDMTSPSSGQLDAGEEGGSQSEEQRHTMTARSAKPRGGPL